MYKCPACGVDEVEGLGRCRCGADLSLLLTLDATVDAWFNRGLAALARQAPGEALEWFSACCIARPSDGPARLAQAKTWALLGRWQEAGDSLAKAGVLNIDEAELAALEAGIQDMAAGCKAVPGKNSVE
jgi:tetratricopeptide (TPR) repeat protein